MDSSCLCRIRDIYRAITNFENELQQAVGLNLNEAMLLCLLSDGKTRLSGEIAETLGITRSNASKVIASLEKQMFIRRQACKEDSRCQKFHITKKGQDKLSQVHCDDIKMPTELECFATRNVDN
jgi:DNA-binding MarR family transcriptional regulator